MIYLNVSPGALPEHYDFSVDVDTTTVSFGLVRQDILKDILEDLLKNVKEELTLL